MSAEELKDLWYQFLASKNVERKQNYVSGPCFTYELSLSIGKRIITSIYIGNKRMTGCGITVDLDDNEYAGMLEGWNKRDEGDYSYEELLKML
jgi:hypothetical protein